MQLGLGNMQVMIKYVLEIVPANTSSQDVCFFHTSV